MSNISPKKPRGPHRPVNTISSPQKPAFAAVPLRSEKQRIVIDLLDSDLESDATFSPASNRQDLSEADIGDSSSLFDQSLSQNLPSSPPAPRPRHTLTNKMVREREPAAPRVPEAPVPKPVKDLATGSPEFGKTSPLRNPLHRDVHRSVNSNPFNVPKPGQSRPEHHRQQQNPSIQPFRSINQQSTARPGTASSVGSDVFEIPATEFIPRQPNGNVAAPKPSAPKVQSIQPAARPIYSSMGHANGFQPVNYPTNPLNPHGSRQTVILPTRPVKRADGSDDEDDFNPDADILAERNKFGAPDPYAYVESGQAGDNIKALLEGAFDDEEGNIPRTRGRKKKKQQEQDDATLSLAKRLEALEVKSKEESKREEEEEEDEEDDGSVDGMKVKLLPHQVEGVSWMIEKETGAHNKRAKLPKGGILADDMGLGKTVQSIALILSNPRPEKDAEPENKKNKILPIVGKGTLVVAPLALIKQWEAEINDKVTKSHSLKVLVHHGPSRTKSVEKLKSYDVVITTYQVLASEHASCGDGPNGIQKGCFGVHWYRIMLDEAHTIKNRNAKMTKACYDVRSHYRWCLTGTPMQNNLDELQSLIRFLRIQPYADMANWKDSITGPMKNGRGNLAMRRLQIFLKAFMKRRTKDVLKKDGALNFGGKSKDGEKKGGFQIVARNIETIVGSFTTKERQFYDRLSNRAETRLAEMMGGAKTDVIGALVLLLRLRQACNHPNLTKTNFKDDKDAMTTGSKPEAGTQTPRKEQPTDADDLADLFGGLTVQTKRCDICQLKLTKENAESDSIRCNDCEADLNMSQKKSKKDKKHRKDKKKDRTRDRHTKPRVVDSEDEDEDASFKPAKGSRQRRVVVDSDDEEGAEWLVPEDQVESNLGKAGGTDDENAEGGGDTLNSIDSEASESEGDDTPSKKKEDSFIVHDTDSEDEAPVVRRKLFKKQAAPKDLEDQSESDVDSESESESDADSEEDESGESEIEYNASDLTPSTKIRQLLQILEKETPDHKVIVFSQFTSMLDLLEPFLRRENFIFTRYDGSMRNDHREASLHKLRNDKRTRVLLCSLKCGSLGLNLTAASRVVIMEPFWNPFVEEQAIDRVHRLNQTVDVTVYRLSIHDSVEERIIELQEAKRKLAQAAIEGGKAIGKLSMKDILALFRREAEFDHAHADDGPDRDIFTKTRVLNEPGRDDAGESQRTEQVRRKAGSLGFKRKDDSVWGRR